jgi:signal transduction histidine kinase
LSATPDQPRKAHFLELTRGLLGAEEIRLVDPAEAPPADPAWISQPVDRGGIELARIDALPSAAAAPDSQLPTMLRLLAQDAAGLLAGERPAPGSIAEDAALARRLVELTGEIEDDDELVGTITATIAPLVAATKAGLAVWHEEGDYLEMLPGSFRAANEINGSARVAGREHLQSLAARVVATGRGSFTNAASEEFPAFRDWFREMGVRQMLTVPLTTGGRTIGVVHVANREGGFSAADVDRLERLTPFVACLVESVHGRLVLDRRTQLGALVTRAATSVASGNSLADFATILERVCTVLEAQLITISFAEEPPTIVVRGSPVTHELEQLLLEQAMSGSAVPRDFARSPRAAGDPGWSMHHVPIRVGGRRKATLSILRTPYRPFQRAERGDLGRLADIVALAWATEQHHRERIQIARLRERERLADDLHDHVAQILFCATMNLESTINSLALDPGQAGGLARVKAMLSRGQEAIRDVVAHLSEPSSASPRGQLAQMVRGVEEEFDVVVGQDLDGEPAGAVVEVPPERVEAATDAAREGIVNAIKHAGPCQIWLRLHVGTDGSMLVSVDDSGVGIGRTPRSDGYGLRAARRKVERCEGSLRLSRSLLGGTRLAVRMPAVPTATVESALFGPAPEPISSAGPSRSTSG